MMHEQTMQRDGARGNTDYSRDPSPGVGNRNTDRQDAGARGFYNAWDGGGAGGAHAAEDHEVATQSNSDDDREGRSRVDSARMRDNHNDDQQSASAQSHAGRGPRGSQASDARIIMEVHRAWTDDAMLDATDLNVAVTDGDVTLSGNVSSREGKRRAERLLDHIEGVTDVHNQIQVMKHS